VKEKRKGKKKKKERGCAWVRIGGFRSEEFILMQGLSFNALTSHYKCPLI